MIIKTVTIVKKDHPAGKVDINECDLKADDVIYSDKQEVKPATKKAKRAKRGV